jgi:predicted kinase
LLYIFSGLPGAGKTSLARLLAQHMGAVYLRIDTVEQALRDLCGVQVEGEGYRLSYRVAADNLNLGLSVVADSCNPIELTRLEWRRVAEDTGAAAVDIEVICSDRSEHRRRVETRQVDVPGLAPPSWEAVVAREYHPWTTERILIETAGREMDRCLKQLVDALAQRVPDLPFSPTPREQKGP